MRRIAGEAEVDFVSRAAEQDNRSGNRLCDRSSEADCDVAVQQRPCRGDANALPFLRQREDEVIVLDQVGRLCGTCDINYRQLKVEESQLGAYRSLP